MNPIALRLLNQQLVSPQFSAPGELVDYMGAIQAQEYRLMRWAVEMRTRRPSTRAFKKAFDAGEIVRLHLLRGTWQLVSARDYWPFVQLCGPKAWTVIRGWMASNGISLPEKEVADVREILVQTAAGKGSVTKEDFAQALAQRGLSMDDHRVSYHIRLAEIEGVLCSGDLSPMKATYALSARKVGPCVPVDRDGTLALLTRKYFRSRQPATLEDFVWWSGLNISDCRRGMALLGDYLHVEKWKGREYFLTEDARTRGFRRGRYLLIPPYDEYLISYKSRHLVLPPEHSHRAHNNSGIFQPVIACDGQICGNWAPFQGSRQADFFLGDHDTDFRDEWDRYLRFREK